jgi:hypothetical protein
LHGIARRRDTRVGDDGNHWRFLWSAGTEAWSDSDDLPRWVVFVVVLGSDDQTRELETGRRKGELYIG